MKHVDLVEGVELDETVAALHIERWREDMYAALSSINQMLPHADDGLWGNDGEKALVIRRWIRSVLDRMIHYKAEHDRVLDEAGSTLQLALAREMVMKHILSFLALPSCTT